MYLERINTTDSERRMHRILYFIKYLRMTILHNILNLAAITAYLCFGIHGVYPLAEMVLEALKGGQAEAGRLGMRSLFYFNVFFVPVFVLIFFTWTYFSIVNTWKKALKLQAVFLFLCVLLYPIFVWAQCSMSFGRLSLIFSLMLLLSHILMLWMVADSAVALWQASKSAENHSFCALVDSRLTNGIWAWFNKILDLPRTILLNFRSFFSYLLAFAGTLFTLRGVISVMMMGGITLKLNGLLGFFSPLTTSEAVAQSRAVAYSSLFELAIGVACVYCGGYLSAVGRRIGAQNVERAIKSSKGRFLLYLRPFSVDDVILQKPSLPLISRLLSFRPFPVKIEEELFDVADGYLPLIAVGRPGTNSKLTAGQAYRDFLADSEWQGYVRQKIETAQAVVIVLRKTDGVLWELENVLAQDQVLKTLFLLDPSASDPSKWKAIMDDILPLFVNAGLLSKDTSFVGTPMAFYFRRDSVVQIENDCWSTTSYRTAFSHFLTIKSGFRSIADRSFK